ncbi:MAG: hypothetical protein Kow00121_04900 [Elainellaceae cyanobacterium]
MPYINQTSIEAKLMITLTDDEVALIRSLLTALRSIKVRDIDKALVILSKGDRLANRLQNPGGRP